MILSPLPQYEYCMFNKILVAVDGSSSSIYALDYAANLANQNNAELKIVSVIESIPTFYTAGSGTIAKQMYEITEENYTKMHGEQRERLKVKYPQLKLTTLIEQGKPVDVINEVSSDSDLIVVGYRGLGGVFNLLLGSVAKQVVESCTIPVLVVKEKTS